MLSGASISRNPHGGMEPSLHTGLVAWGHQGQRLDPDSLIGVMEIRMAEETDGTWMEVGFVSPIRLDGSAAAGWRQGNLALWLERSTDLRRWAQGHFRDCPGSPEKVADGWEYWSRARVPLHWHEVMIDLTATTDRFGKNITDISVLGDAVPLDYPYAMPSDAASLQADLRTAGYSGALVTTTAAANITATIRNHTDAGTFTLTPTHSGSSVTAVSFFGTPISLPGTPYALPADAADLQTDLRAAGYSGAVVMLLADSWTVFLPDISATESRPFSIHIDPGDPFPFWDSFGYYMGENPAATIKGLSGNVRAPDGMHLLESETQFARLAIRTLT